MNRPLLSLALPALVFWASTAPAAQAPQRIQTRPYADLYTPPDAVTSVAGGPGVVLAEEAKSTVVVRYTEGGPCGPNYDSGMTDSGRSGSQSEGGGLLLPIGIIVAAVAGLGIMGFWLLRRARA